MDRVRLRAAGSIETGTSGATDVQTGIMYALQSGPSAWEGKLFWFGPF